MSEILGLKIEVPGATKCIGVLRYLGPIRGKQGTFGGIELQGPGAATRGKNSGAVDGIQYFEVSTPNSGLFLPWGRIRQANPKLTEVKNANLPTPTPSPSNGIGRQLLNERKKFSSRSSSLENPFIGESGLRAASTIEKRVPQMGQNSAEVSPMISRTPLVGLTPEHHISPSEKDELLREMQTTLGDLQLVLEDYERIIEEKDKRLQKQRQEHEKAREEWRESLELMLNGQQETESLYEQQIDDLKEAIGDMRSRMDTRSTEHKSELDRLQEENSKLRRAVVKGDELPSPGIVEMKANIERMAEENERLRKVNDEKQDEIRDLRKKLQVTEAKVSTEDAAISQLSDELKAVELGEKLTTREAEIADLQAQIKARDIQIAEFMTSKGAESQNKDNSIIAELKHQLAMRPSFEELTGLQEALDEAEEIHARDLQQFEKKVADLKQSKEHLNAEIEALHTKVAEAEMKLEEAKKSHPEPLSQTKAVSSQKRELSFTPTSLPVYVPTEPRDPSSGRDDWCGLCEKDGHSSLNCPYELDVF